MQGTAGGAPRRARRLGRRLARRARGLRTGTLWRRLGLPGDSGALLAVVAASAVVAAVHIRWPDQVPLLALSLTILLGGALLTLRSIVLLMVLTGAMVAAAWAADDRIVPRETSEGKAGVAVVLLAMAALVVVLARSRLRLGVAGTRGESMLVDLRDRLQSQGRPPALPHGWGAQVALRSAYGDSFSGDFHVASRSADGRTLEAALVDVSGKGADAGARALLLSGAFGGLLGALPGKEFLPAANQYLLRQEWGEGFATAVHLAVDLGTGDYVVTSAGHPPAAHFVAGSGRWRLIEGSEGPALGLLEEADYAGESGRLGRGDAILLYTDGLIETPGRDLSLGIDRLLGEAERLVPRGFGGGAQRLIDAVGSSGDDDRALVLIWRG